jgi:hypothetical protein
MDAPDGSGGTRANGTKDRLLNFSIVLGIHSLPEFWEYFVTSLWLSAAVVMVAAEWWIHGAPVGNPTMDPIGKAL